MRFMHHAFRKITFSEKTLGLCAQRLSTRVFEENGYFSFFEENGYFFPKT
jgi:hypothetical protein